TIGEGELMAHDVPLGCAPDEYDDLISGTCSHLPEVPESLRVYFDYEAYARDLFSSGYVFHEGYVFSN
ncbi:antirestriction protein ArdA, partial [Klebsiella pneumoniae]